MKKIVSFLFLVSSFLFPIIALAQHFESPSYIIDWGNFNMTSGSKSSQNYKITDTVGQNAPGQYDSQGYIIKSGFQYAYENQYAFSFAIDNLSVELGSLVPGVATTTTNIITVSSPSGHGYDVFASQNHPLSQVIGITIPDTGCNSGTCSESVSGIWTSATAYGFGFNAIGINSSGTVTGVGTSTIFPDSTYFRQFANTRTSEPQQVVMSENSPREGRRARISYKANISSLQAAGNYENSVTFTAIPKY